MHPEGCENPENWLDTHPREDHYLGSALSFLMEEHVETQPTKQLTKTINEWGSVLEAIQRLALQLLGMIALIYLVGRVMWR